MALISGFLSVPEPAIRSPVANKAALFATGIETIVTDEAQPMRSSVSSFQNRFGLYKSGRGLSVRLLT